MATSTSNLIASVWTTISCLAGPPWSSIPLGLMHQQGEGQELLSRQWRSHSEYTRHADNVLGWLGCYSASDFVYHLHFEYILHLYPLNFKHRHIAFSAMVNLLINGWED